MQGFQENGTITILIIYSSEEFRFLEHPVYSNNAQPVQHDIVQCCFDQPGAGCAFFTHGIRCSKI